ncbi:MAG: LuxR family transcriptional regulator, partial [Raoultibacter sp.]
ASLGSRRTVNYCVLAFMIAALGFLVITALPPDASQILVALLPFVSMIYLLRFIRSIPHLARTKCNVAVKEKPPYKLIAISLFFGISFGVMKGLFAPIGEDLTGMRDVLNIAAIVGGSVAVFVTTSIYKMDFDHMTYQVALPLMAAGFLFLPLHEPWNVVGTGVHQFGYQYFYIVLWALWPVLASRANVPSGWIVAWGMFSIQLGQLIGSIASGTVLIFLHTELDLAMLSAGIIFLILLIALFALGNGSANTGWGFVKPIEEEDSSSDFEKTCTRLARQYRLSPREIEVFFLLSKGRNRAHIKDELVISDETVKSHIKNIYRKTDVHSQQELIDMIEA